MGFATQPITRIGSSRKIKRRNEMIPVNGIHTPVRLRFVFMTKQLLPLRISMSKTAAAE
ncbi:hypothetical protein D3C73_1620210 [compost metagenome]